MALHGVLVLDKPAGMSSASAADRVKRALGADRAGHGGTLDPMATGVLPVCLGAATKLAQFLLADDKAYEAVGVLGIATDTLDATGRVVATLPVAVDEAALLQALAGRRGEQDQVPPMFSAIKQGGVRLYDLARAGEEVERAPRRIRIDRLELLAFEPPRFRIAIACTKGTYVRSLVADLGADLGCGAHLAELRRTRSGLFAIEQAVALDRVTEATLVGLTEVTNLPIVRASDPVPILSGRLMPPEELGAENIAELQRFQLVDVTGRLLAIAHHTAGCVRYDRVFPET